MAADAGNQAGTRVREFAFSDQHFKRIRHTVYDYCGINLVDSKRDMVYSRLARRIRAAGLHDFDTYLDYALNDPDAFTDLVNAITTNLTAFFREPHHFQFLAATILPASQAILKNRPLRIWSAGCSTGEEPYSIAITLAEHLNSQQLRRVELLATDVDHNVIAQAAAGVYPLERVATVEQNYLKRWFQRGKGRNEGKVRVAPKLRGLVQFDTLNLLAEWPFREPLDIVFCRNVVIYFDKPTQKKLFTRIAAALGSRGYLVLGHSESLYQVSDRFEPLGKTIYRKLD